MYLAGLVAAWSRHSRGPRRKKRQLRGDGLIAVSVCDQDGPHDPVARDTGLLAESGRGLRTVSRMAESWGWYGNESGRSAAAADAVER